MDIEKLEKYIVELSEESSRGDFYTNNSDIFDLVYVLNKSRSLRLEKFYSLWDYKSFIYFIESKEINNYATLASGVEHYQCSSINLLDILDGPRDRMVQPIVFTNNHIAELLSNITFRQLNEVRSLWRDFPWVVQDFDNHHWFQISLVSQVCSDFYFSSHPFTGQDIDPFIESPAGFVPIGCTQWTLEFLRSNRSRILDGDRVNSPLGAHNFYPKFQHRNVVLKTMNTAFEDIGFTDARRFHSLDGEARFNDWVCRKLHFVAPVSRDVPIRVYDALITGGLALIPRYLQRSLAFFSIPDDLVFYYDLNDLYRPHDLVSRAVADFDRKGREGANARLNFAMDNLHISHSVAKMLGELVMARSNFYPI